MTTESTDTPSSLLPPNATSAERALVDATAAPRVDAPIRALWNPDTCPVGILPWLAWSLSVPNWDSAWSEAQKRAVIKGAIDIHRKAGTIGALRRALSALGYEITVDDQTGDPYTFRLRVIIDDRGLPEGASELFDQAEAVALTNKNVRSKLLSVDALLKSDKRAFVGLGMQSGDTSDIFPKVVRNLFSRAIPFVRAWSRDVLTSLSALFARPEALVMHAEGFAEATSDGAPLAAYFGPTYTVASYSNGAPEAMSDGTLIKTTI